MLPVEATSRAFKAIAAPFSSKSLICASIHFWRAVAARRPAHVPKRYYYPCRNINLIIKADLNLLFNIRGAIKKVDRVMAN